MDFTFPYEIEELRKLVRRFVDDELLPLERHVPGEWEWELPEDIRRRLDERARSLGICSLGVPIEHGGAGLGVLGVVVAREELGRTLVPWRVPGEPSPLLYACDEEQREQFLYPVIRGEKQTCLARTEASAGSDPSGMQTTALRNGDHWIIDGTKQYIEGGHRADFVMLFAVASREEGDGGGITCFLVERETTGFEVAGRTPMMGREAPSELRFNGCRVPNVNVLGAVGEGLQLAQQQLAGYERLVEAPLAIGRAERALVMATDYARLRVTFGKPLSEREAIQWLLADSYLEIHQCRLMTCHAAWKADQGQDISVEASMARVFATEMQQRVIDRAIQVHGGIGLTDDLPLAALYQQVRASRITGGPSEVQRLSIARYVLDRG